jgi:site-specific DNA-methyltransferase (adenine-specific)
MVELNINYNEDCLITMSNIDNESIDLVITSPPYDDLRTYNDKIKGLSTSFNGYSFPFEEIAHELKRILKKGGVIVWVVGDATNKGSETGTSFRQALFFKEIGLDLYDTMIYQKTGTPFPQKTRYNQIFEYMFVFSKGKPKYFNPIMKKNITSGAVRKSRKFRNPNGEMVPAFNGKAINEWGIENNIWLIKNGMYKSTKDLIAFEHPAIFPEELVMKHILTWTEKGDIVYDPFMGSGTSAKCAIMTERNWIGSELDKTYSDIIKQRIENIEPKPNDQFITKESLNNKNNLDLKGEIKNEKKVSKSEQTKLF